MGGMRLSPRVLRRALRASRFERRICCALGALIAAGTCVTLRLRLLVNEYVIAPKLGDIVCAVLAGMPQPPPNPDVLTVVQQLDIPFGWLALMLVPIYLVSTVYPDGQELQGVMVASGSRRACWEGIFMSVLASVLAYWASVAAVCLIATLALGSELTFDTSTWLPSLYDFAHETLTHGSVRSGLPVCLSTLAASCALALAQCALSAAWDRNVAFTLAAALICASLFVMHPLLVGNLMMASRSAEFVVQGPVETEFGAYAPGIELWVSAVLSGTVSLAAVIVGGMIVSARDVLRKDRI